MLFNVMDKLLLKPKTHVLPYTYNDQGLANEFQKLFVTNVKKRQDDPISLALTLLYSS